MTHIKVLQNNFKKEIEEAKVETEFIYPLKTTCDQCDSELEVSEEDIHIGWLGAAFVTCPCCGEETMLDEVEGITLTVDNIDFPVHFLHTSKDKRYCIDVSSEDIVKEIKRAISYFREHKDEWYRYTMYGDLAIFVHRLEGDEIYAVYITKDFYETDIPFDKADY